MFVRNGHPKFVCGQELTLILVEVGNFETFGVKVEVGVVE